MMSKLSWRSSSNPYRESRDSVARGEALYARECASCHGMQGLGDGPAGQSLAIRPTNLRVFIGERDEGYFASQVAYGKTGNPDMPRFVDELSSDEIWHVTNYVYSLGLVSTGAAP